MFIVAQFLIHEFCVAAALELSKLPAKKKLLSQLKHQQQQNAIQNQSALPIGVVNQAHSTTNSINSNIRDPEPMEQDDEEINVNDDDDSPLDMRITKHDSDSDSVRPSVIRRAPSFKETPNSPSRGKAFRDALCVKHLSTLYPF